MKKLLKSADFIVEPYEFKVNRRSNKKTILGGFLTLMIILFTVSYIVSLFIKDFYNQGTIYAGTSGQESDNYVLTSGNAQFVMEISSTDGIIYSDILKLSEYLSIEGTFIYQFRQEGIIGYNRTENQLSLVKCTSALVNQFNFESSSVTDIQKQNMLCLNGTYQINGQFYDQVFQYLKIRIQICKESAKQKCRSIEEITEFIAQGINIDLFIKDSKVKQSLNLTAPAEVYPTNVFWRLTSGIGNNEDIYLAPVKVDIKKNSLLDMLFGIKNTQNILTTSTLQRQERRQEPVSIDFGMAMCTFYLRSSSESQYYFAIQSDWEPVFLSTLSEATALSLALMSLIKVFYRIYNQHITFVKLMNSAYKFDIKTQKSKERLNKQKHEINQSKKKIKLDKIINFKIYYSFFSYILYHLKLITTMMCKQTKLKNNEKIVISQLAKQKIETDLDLTNILKKLYEIDCLKLFLFDDDQLMLFNTFCSPVFQDSILETNLGNSTVDSKNLVYMYSRQISRSQTKQFNKIDFKFTNSNIPFELKLAKISRFFRAELLPVNAEQLIQIYQKIENNENENPHLNKKIIYFAQINQSLYQLITSDKQEFKQTPYEISIPNEMQKKQSIHEQPILSNSVYQINEVEKT